MKWRDVLIGFKNTWKSPRLFNIAQKEQSFSWVCLNRCTRLLSKTIVLVNKVSRWSKSECFNSNWRNDFFATKSSERHSERNESGLKVHEDSDNYCNNTSVIKSTSSKQILRSANNLAEANYQYGKIIFSFNLIYIPSSVADSSVVILSVRKAMSVYVALCFFLTGLIFIASYVWDQHSTKSNRFRCEW